MSRPTHTYRRRPTTASLLISFAGWGAAGCCWAQGASRGGRAAGEWTTGTTLFVVSLAALSLMAVVALIPFAAEYWSPSRTMEEHRRRLKGFGAPGRLTEWLLPHFVDGFPPQRLWGWVLYVCWGGIVALFTAFAFSAQPHQQRHNLIMLPGFAIGLPLFVAFILRFGRGVTRLSQAASETREGSSRRPRSAEENDLAAGDERPDGAERHA